MIGSLVVCLPSSFKGGNLLVRHHGQEVNFDWEAQSGKEIQWAAFYSDCEHEIKQITKGHRVTLTYNFCVTEPVGNLLLNNPIVQPSTLPLYTSLRHLMQDSEFLKDGMYRTIKWCYYGMQTDPIGGTLGVFCSHAYAHTSKIPDALLPRALKGADMVLCSLFKSLGIKVDVRPVLEWNETYDVSNPNLGIGSGKSDEGSSDEEEYGFYGPARPKSAIIGYGLHSYVTSNMGREDGVTVDEVRVVFHDFDAVAF